MRLKKLAAIFMAGVIAITSEAGVMAADFSDGADTPDYRGGGYNPKP